LVCVDGKTVNSGTNQKEAPLLSLEHVSQLYGKSQQGVRDLSFELHRGEKVGLLGLNGAGKSTAFRLITGLLSPDEGQIHVAGHALHRHPNKAREQLGYLPEHASLPLELTARQVIQLEADMRGVSVGNDFAEDYFLELIADCELQDVLDRPLKQLSRGYRKRVALAASLIHRPALLLLDEPTAGLDPHQVDQFRRLIDKVSRRCAVLISTHVLAEVEMICQRCLILHDGALKDDLAIPVMSDGTYEVQMKDGVRGDVPNSELLGEIDGWSHLRMSLDEAPEMWLTRVVNKGCKVRDFRSCSPRLEEIFLAKTQSLPSRSSTSSSSSSRSKLEVQV
jgi:ABC-2 type transport system ATP-binding protein